MNIEHIPVLLKEAVNLLNPKAGGIYVDCTINGGGHAREIIERIKPGGILIGIDCDQKAIEVACEKLGFYPNLKLINDNFRNLDRILKGLKIEFVDGILFDLGFSSLQIEDPGRGFSFLLDGPLDMRMNRNIPKTAAELVNHSSVEELMRLFRDYGEEHFAKPIAKHIARRREEKPIQTTKELAQIVLEAIPQKYRRLRIHPATRVFQALRIAVNDELVALEVGLQKAIGLLSCEGQVGVISYHSLEDRIVKHTFIEFARSGKLEILTKKPVRPSRAEVELNPRARSAKLRAAVKR